MSGEDIMLNCGFNTGFIYELWVSEFILLNIDVKMLWRAAWLNYTSGQIYSMYCAWKLIYRLPTAFVDNIGGDWGLLKRQV